MKKELYEQPTIEVVEMEVQGAIMDDPSGSGSDMPWG